MKLDFNKSGGLIPAIIQDNETHRVLMLGYMNDDALAKTEKEGRVTFFSRSKERLWTKGEESGNFLYVREILKDCDDDTLLIKVNPAGPVCHTGADTCFEELNSGGIHFLLKLESIIHSRKTGSIDKSYTASLFEKGIKKIAQKVGEEATEVVIDAIADDIPHLKEESADLIYHLLVLLAAKNIPLEVISALLSERHNK